MIILSLDYSYSKTGWAITDVNLHQGKMELVDCGLLVSDKDLKFIHRASNHVFDIESLIYQYKPDIIIKESAIMGRSSTGLPVIKAHGILEYVINENHLIDMQEIHNQSIKAWARKFLLDNEYYGKDQLKEIDKKKMVAFAVMNYYSDNIFDVGDMIYTARGRLMDDISDAIAIGIIEGEKFLK